MPTRTFEEICVGKPGHCHLGIPISFIEKLRHVMLLLEEGEPPILIAVTDADELIPADHAKPALNALAAAIREQAIPFFHYYGKRKNCIIQYKIYALYTL